MRWQLVCLLYAMALAVVITFGVRLIQGVLQAPLFHVEQESRDAGDH